MSSPNLVLASSSRYRRVLLERLHVRFTVVAPNVDETPFPHESPEQTALRLAECKARAASRPDHEALVIGSDQIASIGELRIGKPGTHDNAAAQLRAMRGKAVVFQTALCLFNSATGTVQLQNVPTTVWYRNYSDAQIERYLATDRPYDCAGSARIESLGISLIERMKSSDPTALIGLPLLALTGMLMREGMEIP